MLADHSFLISDDGQLKPMTSEHTAVAPKSPKAFRNSLSHQLRYFRFTHRTKMVLEQEESKQLEDKTNQEDDGALKYFNP